MSCASLRTALSLHCQFWAVLRLRQCSAFLCLEYLNVTCQPAVNWRGAIWYVSRISGVFHVFLPACFQAASSSYCFMRNMRRWLIITLVLWHLCQIVVTISRVHVLLLTGQEFSRWDSDTLSTHALSSRFGLRIPMIPKISSEYFLSTKEVCWYSREQAGLANIRHQIFFKCHRFDLNLSLRGPADFCEP